MALRTIDTTIKLDGEQSFKNGLAEMRREMRVLESESRALASGFGSTGDAAAQAAAKQKNLQNQISQQEQIVAALEIAVKKSVKAYGEGSAQADGYAVKLNNARTKLANLQKALSNADREVEELGRDSQKAGTQISKGIGEGAKDAENDVRSLMETMQDSLDSIKSSTEIVAFSTVWDTATSAYNAVAGYVEGTAEYRRQLSYLLQNAGKNDYGLEETRDMLVQVQGMTADAGSAVEGLSNLMRIGFPHKWQMEQAMKNLLGATVEWPETMKFENLAESLQETLATGAAVGSYGELLERLGVDLDSFNKALEKSATYEGDIETALKYMESEKLAEAYQKYREENADLVKEMETIARLEYESARIGAVLAKNVVTPLKTEWAGALEWIANSLEAWETGGLNAFFESLDKGVETPRERMKREAEEGTLETDNFFGKFTQWWTDLLTGDKGKEAGTEYTEGFASAFDTSERDALLEANRAWMDYNETASKAGEEAGSEYAESFGAEMQEAGETGGEMLKDGFDGGVESGESSARNAGEAFGAAYAQGILSKVGYATSAAASLAAAAAKAAAARADAAATAAQGTFSAVVNIDGRQAGMLIAPYVSEIMAVTVE